MFEHSINDVSTAIPTGQDKASSDRDRNHNANRGVEPLSGSAPASSGYDVDENISEYQHYPEIGSPGGFPITQHQQNALPPLDMRPGVFLCPDHGSSKCGCDKFPGRPVEVDGSGCRDALPHRFRTCRVTGRITCMWCKRRASELRLLPHLYMQALKTCEGGSDDWFSVTHSDVMRVYGGVR